MNVLYRLIPKNIQQNVVFTGVLAEMVFQRREKGLIREVINLAAIDSYRGYLEFCFLFLVRFCRYSFDG